MNAPAPTPDLLEPQIRALFAALDHAGDLPLQGNEGRTVSGEAGREADGTRVRFTLRLLRGQVVAARYRVYGCPHTLATCEWLARQIEGGLPVDSPLQWSKQLGLPPAKLGRLLVIEDALRAALAQT